MSAQVTEAHRVAADAIFALAMKSSHHGAPFREPCAQIIADSEARATAQANAQVESLISSAKNAIPASEHPAEPTVENWAWQIRNLGADRRLVYAECDQLRQQVANLTHSNDSHRQTAEKWCAAAVERDQLRAEVEESKARERAAIASWDEERQRALREGGRVVELRAELALLREWQREVIQNANAHHAELKEAIARAESAESELAGIRALADRRNKRYHVEDTTHQLVVALDQALDIAQAELAATKSTLDEEVNCAEKAEHEVVRQYARAERAESELATERARLDWLEGNAGDIPRYNSRSFVWSTNQNIRAAIDAAIKEGAK